MHIPVRERVTAPLLSWCLKEGALHVHSPSQLLAKLMAVRVHLDESGLDHGGLRVVPRSHLDGRLSAGAVAFGTRHLGKG